MKAKTLLMELRKEFFTLINESFKETGWNHHYAGKCFDAATESLLERIKQGEFRKDRPFEEEALESFKALVNSEESEKFMRDYYGHNR